MLTGGPFAISEQGSSKALGVRAKHAIQKREVHSVGVWGWCRRSLESDSGRAVLPQSLALATSQDTDAQFADEQTEAHAWALGRWQSGAEPRLNLNLHLPQDGSCCAILTTGLSRE